MAAVRINWAVRCVPVVVSTILISATACASPQKQVPAAGPDTEHRPALFYAKDGAVYVSDPAGTPGRKLTDGPADTDPAPSPDGGRLAFVRKGSREDRGGELWVMDLSADSAPASAPRRLVDSRNLTPTFDGDDPAKSTLERPRWSPAGDRIAFLKSTLGGGGFLQTATADTGTVQAPRQPLLADENYDWSPDGRQIAWAGGRSDVSPVDVNVLTVGESSTAIVVGTNATSVAFDSDRRSVLFTNSDATGNPFAAIPFKFRPGGVYSWQPPPAAPHPVFTGSGSYADVAALWKGAVGFTQWSADQKTKSIQVVKPGAAPHTIADTRSDAQGPQWVGDTVAYVGTADDRPLLITTDENGGDAKKEPQRIDVGVDAFAWGD